MALFVDIEPPSPQEKGDDRGFYNFIRGNKFKAFSKKLHSFKHHLIRKLSFCGQKCQIVKSKLKKSGAKVSSNQFLPHIAISLLFMIVAFSNIHDRVQAYYLSHELNNLDPNIELAVTDNVGEYTPQIKHDSLIVEKSIQAAQFAGGFTTVASPVNTAITARVEPLPDNTSSSVNYIVRQGDTLSGLGWKFSVKLATLAYVNNLDNTELIKPGIQLKIPEKDYEVPASMIAAKQKQKEDAKLAEAKKKSKITTAAASTGTGKAPTKISAPAGSARNAYPYGYCTYYVATKRAVPANWGNANRWLSSARNAGYSTGSTPVVGSIVATAESYWGHVAYVESVSGNTFTISEMNAPIWGGRTTRTLTVGEGKIKGFIY